MKYIFGILLLLSSFFAQAQTVKGIFSGYANIQAVSGAGPTYTLNITGFVGSPQFQPNGPWLSADVQVGDVIWLDCARFVITTINSTGPGSMNVDVEVPSIDWSLGVSNPLVNQRVAVVHEMSGVPSLPPPADGNAGALSGIDGNLYSCLMAHYSWNVDKLIREATEVALVSGTGVPSSTLHTVDGYNLAKNGMGDGDLYEWNGTAFVLNERSGGEPISVKSYAVKNSVTPASAFNSLLAKYLVEGGNLVIDTTINITTNTSTSSLLTLEVVKGGLFNISTGVTLTVNGLLEANPSQQIFTWAGTGNVQLNQKVPVVYPYWFGAKNDGSIDCYASAQKAINVANASDIKVVEFFAGDHPLSKGLLIKEGTFSSLELRGAKSYDGGAAGTQLKMTDSTTFCIGVQGARAVKISGFYIRGWGSTFNPDLGQLITLTNQQFRDQWGRNTRYSPHAGIVIDPFQNGGVPADGGYPGFTSEYTSGNTLSSNVTIEHCVIRYFIGGIVISPTTATGNGSEIVIDDVHIDRCQYGLTTSQTQSRQVSFTNGVIAQTQINTDGRTFGNQNGPMPTFSNMEFGYCKQILNFNNGGGDGKISNMYCESVWQLGNWSGNFFTLTFDKCEINFTIPAESGVGDPASILDSGTKVNFFGGAIGYTTYRPIEFNVKSLNFNGTSIRNYIINKPDGGLAGNSIHYENCRIDGYLGTDQADPFKREAILTDISQVTPRLALPGFKISYPEYGTNDNNTAVLEDLKSGQQYVTFVDNSIAVTVNHTLHTATWTTTQPGKYQLGDFITSYNNNSSVTPSGASTVCSFGKVSSIVGNVITCDQTPLGISSGTYTLYLYEMKYVIPTHRASITSGTNKLIVTSKATDRTVAQMWPIGARVSHAGSAFNFGIYSGLYVLSVVADTIFLSGNSGATFVDVEIYSAPIKTIYYSADNTYQETGSTYRNVGYRTGDEIIFASHPYRHSAIVTSGGFTPTVKFLYKPISGTTGARPTPTSLDVNLTYYNTTTSTYEVWNGTTWVSAGADNWGSQTVVTTGSTLSGNGTSGTPLQVANNGIGATQIADGAITMAKINQAGATSGQVIKWNGSAWAPGSDDVGGGGGATNISITHAPGSVTVNSDSGADGVVNPANATDAGVMIPAQFNKLANISITQPVDLDALESASHAAVTLSGENYLSIAGQVVTANAVNLANTNVTGTLPLTKGGTGQTTAQLAINSLAGGVTSGQYLRGNGTNVVMSTIQVADVPTLNQNTTGSAGSVSGTNVITNTNLAQTAAKSVKGNFTNVTANVADNAATAADQVLVNNSANTALQWGQVQTGGIADNAITSAKILNGTIAATDLANSGATAGSYTNANVTVNAQGLITAVSNGSGGAAIPVDQFAFGTGSSITSSPRFVRSSDTLKIVNGIIQIRPSQTFSNHFMLNFSPRKNLAATGNMGIWRMPMDSFAERARTDYLHGAFPPWMMTASWDRSINLGMSPIDSTGNMIVNEGFNYDLSDPRYNPKFPSFYQSTEYKYRAVGSNKSWVERHWEFRDTLGRTFRPVTIAVGYDGSYSDIGFNADYTHIDKSPDKAALTPGIIKWLDVNHVSGAITKNYNESVTITPKYSGNLIQKTRNKTGAPAYVNILRHENNDILQVGDSAGVRLINTLWFNVNSATPTIKSSTTVLKFDSMLVDFVSQPSVFRNFTFTAPGSANKMQTLYDGTVYGLGSFSNQEFIFNVDRRASNYALSINQNSKLGIGFLNPFSKVDVAQPTNDLAGGFRLNNAALANYVGQYVNSTGDYLFNFSGTERIRVNSTGRLRIGDGTSPSEALDVVGNVRLSGALMPNNLPGTSGQVLTSAGAGAPPTWTTVSDAQTLFQDDRTISSIDLGITGGNIYTIPAATSTLAGLMTGDNFSDIADLTTLTGVASNAVNLGTFTGVTIPDNQTIKQSLQALETAVESGTGAPINATYITQTANGTLTNEQALSSLSTGLMKVTTATGVISTAVAGTDYQAPLTNPVTGTGATNYLAYWNGTGTMTGSPNLTQTGGNKLILGDYTTAGGLEIRGHQQINAGAQVITASNNRPLSVIANYSTTTNNTSIDGIYTAVSNANDGTTAGHQIYGARLTATAAANSAAGAVGGASISSSNFSTNTAALYGLYARVDEFATSGTLGDRVAGRFDVFKQTNSIDAGNASGFSTTVADNTAAGRWDVAYGGTFYVSNAKTAFAANVGTNNSKGNNNTVTGVYVDNTVTGAGVVATTMTGIQVNAASNSSASVGTYYGIIQASIPSSVTTAYAYHNNTAGRLYSLGNVSIGQDLNNAALSVAGSGTTSGTYALRIANSTGTNNMLTVRNDERIGILVSNPTATLHMSQTIIASVGSGNGTTATTFFNFAGTQGGSSTATTGTIFGGNAGNGTIILGNGGSVTGSPTTGFGGNGGVLDFRAGSGGLANTFGGAGGNATFQSGDGGQGATPGAPGWNKIAAGNAAASSNGNGANVYVAGGAKDGSGTDGYILLQATPSANTRGSGVGVGRLGIPTATIHLGENARLTGSIAMDGATSGTYKLTVPASVTSYTMTMPAAVGTTDQVLSAVDNAGTLGWSNKSSDLLGYGSENTTGSTFQITGTKTNVVVQSGTTAVILPEIVASAPGSNQVIPSKIICVSNLTSSTITVSRGGTSDNLLPGDVTQFSLGKNQIAWFQSTSANSWTYLRSTASMEKEIVTTGSPTISNDVRYFYYDPATNQTSVTITMPANPNDGDEITIMFGGQVAAAATVINNLTMSPNTGQALYGTAAPASALGGDSLRYIYRANTGRWYRIIL
jgi:hypothetical protein